MSNPRYKTVAKAVRLERVENTDEFFIVFKITDEQFKKRIRDNWSEEIELEVIDKSLVIKE